LRLLLQEGGAGHTTDKNIHVKATKGAATATSKRKTEANPPWLSQALGRANHATAAHAGPPLIRKNETELNADKTDAA
jgi:hypothetical protein